MYIRQLLSSVFLTGLLSIGIFGGTVTGRISSVAVDPSDPSGNTIYVSTAGGGVWKTTDGGTSWILQIALTVAPLLG
jgi:hypothetical protein